VFRTAVCGADCCYLAALIGLKELAVVGKDPADYGDRCTGIQKRPHSSRLRIFEADSTPGRNNVTRIHYYDANARVWIALLEALQCALGLEAKALH
jgi:hypothetical protein